MHEDQNKIDRNTKLIGLYLLKKGFISGQFTMAWSVHGFHISPEAFDWADENIYKRNKDLANVLIGAILAIIGSVIAVKIQNSSTKIDNKQFKKIIQVIQTHSNNFTKKLDIDLDRFKMMNDQNVKNIENLYILNSERKKELELLMKKRRSR